MFRALSTAGLLLLSAAGPTLSQSTGLGTLPITGDRTTPAPPGREIAFETSRGTWMSVDVSPDGRRIIFDLLGDIYVMPIEGGRASLLSGGSAFESQPRFSPDGRRIAFTSDRDGLENLWVMDANGRNARQITRERERHVSNPAWTPDGGFLVGRKHFRDSRSLGAGEMWLYGVAGGPAAGVRLTERRSWEHNAGEPIVSADGRYVYFTEDVSEGTVFRYNRDPHGIIYVVQRLDRQTGSRETWLRAPGGSLRPQLSPDGRTMSFIRRVGARTALMLHDMESGRERLLWDGLDRDQQEGWAIFGTYPGYAWTPDARSIVIWAQGSIWRVDIRTGARSEIPFVVPVTQWVNEPVRGTPAPLEGPLDVRMLRWTTVSPDGERVVFGALGKLWIRELGGGSPRRLTDSEGRRELFPSWSPDGSEVVYSTWSDAEQGSVRIASVEGDTSRRLTRIAGHYVTPSFSADGRRIVFRRVGGDPLRGELFTRDLGVYVVPAAGGAPVLATTEGTHPRFSRAGDRIFLTSTDDDLPALVSVSLAGGDRRVHVRAYGASEFVPSPDERSVAVLGRFRVHLAPLSLSGEAFDTPTTAEPLIRHAGASVHWSGSGDRLYWTIGPHLHQRVLGASAPEEDHPVAHLGFTRPTDAPTGTLALVGGTILTMASEAPIARGTVLLDGNRIAAVGPADEVAIPSSATVIDVSGKYLMPGLIDVHTHLPLGSEGMGPQVNWALLANLAFGVTTLHDPGATDTDLILSTAEMIRAGIVIGPRLLSSGRPLYGAEADFRAIVDTPGDALAHVHRLREAGASSVKSYNQPRRDVRQQLVEAARALGIMILPEGGSTYAFNITHILDGHTGLEHNIPIAPLYDDVLTLMGEAGIAYTPTLAVNYGGMYGVNYWFQESEVWENARLRRFTPPGELDARARRRQMAPLEEYSHVTAARGARDVLDRGGRIQLGSHGSLQGLGVHWELWSLAQGGLTAFEALYAATVAGAEYLGLEADLGTIEPGKLADLIVLERNPLESVRNSESIRLVIANGRIYDAATLERLGDDAASPPPLPWEHGTGTGAAPH